jgi:hypothetical protein
VCLCAPVSLRRARRAAHVCARARSVGAPCVPCLVCGQLAACAHIRGLPRWCDRFSQYGIKVSFWASGTLKIVIYVELTSKTTPRNDVFVWLIITPSGGGGC